MKYTFPTFNIRNDQNVSPLWRAGYEPNLNGTEIQKHQRPQIDWCALKRLPWFEDIPFIEVLRTPFVLNLKSSMLSLVETLVFIQYMCTTTVFVPPIIVKGTLALGLFHHFQRPGMCDKPVDS